ACAATPWVLVVPVDVINLPSDLVARLSLAAERDAAPLAYASTEDSCRAGSGTADSSEPVRAGRIQPLCMIAHISLAPGLRAYLQAGERKVRLWQQRSGAVPVFFEGGEDVFTNINTREDLQRAERSAHGGQ